MTSFFPGQFNTATSKEYHDLLRERALLQLDSMSLTGDDRANIEELISIKSYEILTHSDLQKFFGPDSAEIQFEKKFQASVSSVEDSYKAKVSDMTVMKFYSVLDYLKEKQKRQEKLNKSKSVNRNGR